MTCKYIICLMPSRAILLCIALITCIQIHHHPVSLCCAATRTLGGATGASRNETFDGIPLILYKTGPFPSDDIPANIRQRIEVSCRMLGAELRYFTDAACRQHVEAHFDTSVVQAYDSLIPSAYKADLWRMCVLYTHGGIYGDVSQKVLIPIDVNARAAHMVLVKDRNICNNVNSIQISFMACAPRSPVLNYIIERITEGIHRKHMGRCALDITGPVAFGTHLCEFLGVERILDGRHTYTDAGGSSYVIDVRFRETGGFLADIHDDSVRHFETKAANHAELVYASSGRNYEYMYNHNSVYVEKNATQKTIKNLKKSIINTNLVTN